MVNSSLFRRIELQMLMNLTARALGQKPKRIWTLSNAEALRAYAEYTCSNLQADADETLFERMNTGAYRMGRLLRQLFLISNDGFRQTSSGLISTSFMTSWSLSSSKTLDRV